MQTENPEAAKNFFPFSVSFDSDPLARIIEAALVTDAGSAVKRLSLLVQRDDYLLNDEDRQGITNPDIDRHWQKAFSLHRANRDGSSVLLARQISAEGTLLPFQPLFFCRARSRYFAPPCPSCGIPLQLCADDERLAGAGLRPYSTSLRRYLQCPECSRIAGEPFYALNRDPSESAVCEDLGGLVRRFGNLVAGSRGADGFPCGSCSSCGECYGPQHMAASRIAPFGFYPFYMFIFEAPDLKASDFLTLFSGFREHERAPRMAKPEPEPEKAPAPEIREEAAIQDLLIRIAGKWRRQMEREEKGEEIETVVLPSAGAQPDSGDGIAETVILSGSPQVPKAQEIRRESVPETVILSPGDRASALKGGTKPASPPAEEKNRAKEKKQEEDLLSETVILTPDKIRELTKKTR
ncbi:MAG TPA: hypothetical protein VLS90_20740 [Thermodesulfobacteriota bacterium]|nr:hypothetical protein [Thermodesulfobacteriota bacterium]